MRRSFQTAGIAAISLAMLSQAGIAADLTQKPPAPVPVLAQNDLYDLNRFEIRGGFLANTWGNETGTVDINGELIAPKFVKLNSWADYLIPRLHIGGMGNLSGRTSYGYAGGLWTVDFYRRYFVDLSLGGAIHNGELIGSDPKRNELGCRVLYHIGADGGYRFDQNWSAMLTFDHISNGAGTLSNCKVNQGITVVGVRLGYTF